MAPDGPGQMLRTVVVNIEGVPQIRLQLPAHYSLAQINDAVGDIYNEKRTSRAPFMLRLKRVIKMEGDGSLILDFSLVLFEFEGLSWQEALKLVWAIPPGLLMPKVRAFMQNTDITRLVDGRYFEHMPFDIDSPNVLDSCRVNELFEYLLPTKHEQMKALAYLQQTFLLSYKQVMTPADLSHKIIERCSFIPNSSPFPRTVPAASGSGSDRLIDAIDHADILQTCGRFVCLWLSCFDDVRDDKCVTAIRGLASDLRAAASERLADTLERLLDSPFSYEGPPVTKILRPHSKTMGDWQLHPGYPGQLSLSELDPQSLALHLSFAIHSCYLRIQPRELQNVTSPDECKEVTNILNVAKAISWFARREVQRDSYKMVVTALRLLELRNYEAALAVFRGIEKDVPSGTEQWDRLRTKGGQILDYAANFRAYEKVFLEQHVQTHAFCIPILEHALLSIQQCLQLPTYRQGDFVPHINVRRLRDIYNATYMYLQFQLEPHIDYSSVDAALIEPLTNIFR